MLCGHTICSVKKHVSWLLQDGKWDTWMNYTYLISIGGITILPMIANSFAINKEQRSPINTLKAAGWGLLGVVTVIIMILVYDYTLFSIFFDPASGTLEKFLIRSVGHTMIFYIFFQLLYEIAKGLNRIKAPGAELVVGPGIGK